MSYSTHRWKTEDGTCRFHGCDSDATYKLVINRSIGTDEVHGCESCCNEYLLEDGEYPESRVVELDESKEGSGK